MPPVPIIDSHVHLWDPVKVEIPWLSNVPPINVKRGPDDYAEATSGLDVQGLVYLQVEVAPPYALLEARDLVEPRPVGQRVMGVVPWAPLEYGDKVRYFLEEMAAIGPEIKGIRRIVQDEPDPEFCLQPRYIEGTRALPDYGLTADLCCNFRQLGPTVELVRQCPNTQFILDHIAKPNIRGGEMEPWAGQMRDLASLPERDLQDQRRRDRGQPRFVDHRSRSVPTSCTHLKSSARIGSSSAATGRSARSRHPTGAGSRPSTS